AANRACRQAMADVSPARPPCTPLSGRDRNSSAFKSLGVRLPTILAKAVDGLVRASHDLAVARTAPAEADTGASGATDVREECEEAKALVSALGLMRHELQHGKPLR